MDSRCRYACTNSTYLLGQTQWVWKHFKIQSTWVRIWIAKRQSLSMWYKVEGNLTLRWLIISKNSDNSESLSGQSLVNPDNLEFD